MSIVLITLGLQEFTPPAGTKVIRQHELDRTQAATKAETPAEPRWHVQMLAYRALLKKPMTVEEMAEKMNLTPRSCRNRMHFYYEMGLVKRIPNKTGRRYVKWQWAAK